MKIAKPLLLAVALGAIVLGSIDARTDWFVPAETTPQFEDAPTGAILLDIDDDASTGDEAELVQELRRAVAPYAWDGRLGQVVLEEAGLYRIHAPRSEHADILAMLGDEGSVESVEVERYWSLPPEAEAFRVAPADAAADGPDVVRPNDPYYKHQWHLDQIQMPRAWARSSGEGAVVAVIDTGVAFEDRRGRRRSFTRAPDLEESRFVPGFDFVERDDHPNDEHGHGTHVAGTIAQTTNNALGVAGVAPSASIMPLRVLDARGRGSFGDVAAAIRWAADHGADVINMSLGGGLPSQAVRRAVDYAHGKGVVVIAAAGNSSRSRVEYPALHRHVIAVGAVRFDEELTFYSCYGRGLDLVAPGGDTRVDQNGDGVADGVIQNTLVRGSTEAHDYIGYMGTSMAAPHAAGVAALIRAEGIQDPDTVERILLESAKDKKDRRRYGAGLLQADAAITLARQGAGGIRGLLAVAFGALLMFGLRRREKLGVSAVPTLGVAFLVAGGLAVLPWHLLHWVVGTTAAGAIVTATSGVPSLLAQAGPWLTPVLLTALVPFGLASLLLGAKRAAPVVAGTAVAFAAWLFLEALVPTAGVGLMPAALVGPWLLLQAGLAFVLARLAATRP